MVVLPFLIALGSTAPSERPWEVELKEAGMTIWNREVPNSDVLEVKAEKELPFSSKIIWEVLTDLDSYKAFMPYVEKAEVIEKLSDKSQIEYHWRDPPFVKKRDYTIQVDLEEYPSSGLFIMSWKLRNDKAPPLPADTVRLSELRGQWVVEPLAPNKSRLVYQNYADAGGWMPSWVLNYANRKGVPELYEAVAKRAKLIRRFKKAKKG